MLSLAQRLASVHPKARSKVRDTAKYVSKSLQEFYIQQDSAGFWRIKMYRNPGRVAPSIDGTYLSELEAERALVSYLKSTDKFGKAIYPTHG